MELKKLLHSPPYSRYNNMNKIEKFGNVVNLRLVLTQISECKIQRQVIFIVFCKSFGPQLMVDSTVNKLQVILPTYADGKKIKALSVYYVKFCCILLAIFTGLLKLNCSDVEATGALCLLTLVSSFQEVLVRCIMHMLLRCMPYSMQCSST